VNSQEGHVDLQSWMAMMSRELANIAYLLGNQEDANYFSIFEQEYLAVLKHQFWDEESAAFFDFFMNGTQKTFVRHFGYPSTLPLFLELLESESSLFEKTLSEIESKLLTPYGLASLSPDDPLFGSEEDYWRGAIWININFLGLKALKRYGVQSSAANSLYLELRQRLIQTLTSEWTRTRYVWEQYDAGTGRGRRNHPFTGWSSLIALIISEKL